MFLRVSRRQQKHKNYPVCKELNYAELEAHKGMFSFATFIAKSRILNHLNCSEYEKRVIARLIELKENINYDYIYEPSILQGINFPVTALKAYQKGRLL